MFHLCDSNMWMSYPDECSHWSISFISDQQDDTSDASVREKVATTQDYNSNNHNQISTVVDQSDIHTKNMSSPSTNVKTETMITEAGNIHPKYLRRAKRSQSLCSLIRYSTVRVPENPVEDEIIGAVARANDLTYRTLSNEIDEIYHDPDDRTAILRPKVRSGNCQYKTVYYYHKKNRF